MSSWYSPPKSREFSLGGCLAFILFSLVCLYFQDEIALFFGFALLAAQAFFVVVVLLLGLKALFDHRATSKS